jgi:hypothetical protein
MRWTPYLDRCLRSLEESKDCATDELLVYHVRLRLICDRALAVNIPPAAIPQDIYAQMFQSQVDELQKSMPTNLQSNGSETLSSKISLC